MLYVTCEKKLSCSEIGFDYSNMETARTAELVIEMTLKYISEVHIKNSEKF
jgi:acyl-CoA thioesterase FadM